MGQLSKLCITLLSYDATEQVNDLSCCAYRPLTTLAERRLRGLFATGHENIHRPDHLGTRRRSDGAPVDPVSVSKFRADFES